MNVLTPVTVVLVVRVTVVLVASEPCQEDDDCGWCGYCRLGATPSENNCFIPSPDVELKDGDCRLVKNQCPEFCKNGATCSHEVGHVIPRCICNTDKFYGKQCENKVPQGSEQTLATGIRVYMAPEKDPQRKYRIRVYVDPYLKGNGLSLFIELSEGWFTWTNTHEKCANERINVYKRLCPNGNCFVTELPKYCYSALCYAPYKQYGEPGVMEFTSGTLGYLMDVTVTAWNGDTVVFTHTYKRLVYYQDHGYDKQDIHKFMPVAKLLNCERKYTKRIKYTRRSSLSFNADSNSGRFDTNQILIQWVLLLVDFNYGQYKQVDSASSGFNWNIKPFVLESGTYKVEITVTNVAAYKFVNFDQCFIEIIKQNLEAQVLGGAARTVSTGEDLLLSARGTDPNEPLRKQPDFKYYWSCTPACDHIVKNQNRWKPHVLIPSGVFEDKQLYNFTVTVTVNNGFETAKAYQIVTVSGSSGSGMTIYCIINCLKKVIPVDGLAFEVRTVSVNEKQSDSLTWTYSVVGEEDKESPTDAIRDYSYPEHILYIMPNKLEEGKAYRFYVTCKKNRISATTKVVVGKRPANGSCTVRPAEGVALKTKFTITCSGYNDEDSLLLYEYYDNHGSGMNGEFEGRMIDSNRGGHLSNVILTRGFVVVYIYNIYGIPAVSESKIKLTSYAASSLEVDEMFNEINMLKERKEFISSLRLASMMPDAMKSSEDKISTAKKLISILRDTSYFTSRQYKIGLSILKNTIASLTKESNISLEYAFGKDILGLLALFAQYFKVNSLKYSSFVTTKETMQQMTVAFLDIIDFTIKRLDEHFMPVDEYQINPSDYRNALDFSSRFQQTLDDIGYANTVNSQKGMNMKTIHSSLALTSLRVIVDSSDILQTKLLNDSSICVKFSSELVDKLKVHDEVALQSIKIRYNPFWSYRKNISTDLISLKLYKKKRLNYLLPITHFFSPLDIYLNVTSRNIGSIKMSAIQPDPTSDKDKLDREVTVTRIDRAAKSKLFLKFDFNNPDDVIRVFGTERVRPDYDFMITNHSKMITNSSPSYEVPYNLSEVDTFIYIGILAGPKIPTGGIVNFTMHVFFNLCLTLVDSYWIPDHCEVGNDTNTTMIHCKCTHLSIMSAIFAIPPTEIDPFNEAVLFLTVTDNALVVIIVISALLIFILLCVWARYEDQKEELEREIIFLEDNFPEDPYFYVLGVFTGFRINAGSDANVGIRIVGDRETSRSHILKSQLRKVFSANADDWFLLRSPLYLGEVKYLHLWHDNSGSSPDWYCEKIIVIDMKSLTTYTFYVEQWLSLDVGQYYAEALVPTATAADFNNRGRIFFDNLINGFRNTHLFGGVIARHPRHVMNRLDKIITLMVLAMVAMLGNIAFYAVKLPPGFDTPNHWLTDKDILIPIQAAVINFVVFLIVYYLFKTSYVIKKDVEKHQTFIYTRKESITNQGGPSIDSEPALFVLRGNEEKKKNESFLENIISFLRRGFKTEPLMPVSFLHTDRIIQRRRAWLTIAWILSAFLVTCSSYLVMLYGLKLGIEVSKKWVTSVFFTLFDQFILITPTKILLLGILLALVFEHVVYTTNYQIVMGDIDLTMCRSALQDESQLVALRSQLMYRPLTPDEVEDWRIVRRRQRHQEAMTEMIAIVVFALLLFFTNFNHKNWYEFQANSHIGQMVLYNKNPSLIKFQNILSDTNLNDYLRDTFVDALYELNWYNLDNIDNKKVKNEEAYWTSDCTSKLIGPPVLRQLRVPPGTCSVNHMFKNWSVSGCIAHWSSSTEDTDSYTFNWRMISWYYNYREVSKPWKFSEPQDTPFTARRGATCNLYHSGGYVATLSRSKEKTMESLLSLRRGAWVNQYTTVVFVTLSLYNVNYNLFTQVNLMAEQLRSGGFVTMAMVYSDQLDIFTNVWCISYTLFILYFIVKCMSTINRIGLIQYFSSALNILQISLVALGNLCVVFFTIHWFKSAQDLKKFLSQFQDHAFPFAEIFVYATRAESLSRLLFCGLVVYLLCVWFSNRLTSLVYQTLISTKGPLLFLLILIISFSFVSMILQGYLFNIELDTNIIFAKWSYIAQYGDGSLPTKATVALMLVYKLFNISMIVLLVCSYKFVH